MDSLQDSALRALEAVLNRALALDPGTCAGLAALAGRRIEVACSLPALTLQIGFTDEGRLRLAWDAIEPADLSLSGSALALVTLAVDRSDRVSFVGTGVEAAGNQDLLRQLRSVLHNLDIDWEDALATLIGDVPAHMLADSLRMANRWRREASSRAMSGVGEYVREEARLTPTRTEMAILTAATRQLNLDVDRIEARIDRLTQTRPPTATP